MALAKKPAPAAKAAKAMPAAKAPTKTAAKTAAPAKTATAAKVTLKHIAAELAEAHATPKKQAEAMLSGMIDSMVRHLKDGSSVRINGLGILQVRARPARMGRNPATGEAIQIKASKKVGFRPAKELKDAI